MPDNVEEKTPKQIAEDLGNLALIGLQVQNVKRVSAVELAFDNEKGGLTIIAGKNGQGKSSILDSVWYALGGARNLPPNPIKDGEKEAYIGLEFDKVTVVRRIWYNKRRELKSKIEVLPKTGIAFSSPQAILDELLGPLSFDPLAFQRMTETEQRSHLLSVVTLDIDLDRTDLQLAGFEQDRRELKKTLAELKGAFSAAPKPEADTPAEEISVTSLTTEYEEVRGLIAARDEAANDVVEADNAVQRQLEVVSRLRDELVLAERKLHDLEGILHDAGHSLDEHDNDLDEREKTIMNQIKSVDDDNQKVRAAQAYYRLEKKVSEATDALDTKQAQIDGLRELKNEALNKAAFPVDGLSIDDTGVLFNGRPFKQAADSEQLRVSMALAMACNPKVRVITSKHGGDLDAEALKELDRLAAQTEFRVLLEMVSDDGSAGIVIEDGEVKT